MSEDRDSRSGATRRQFLKSGAAAGVGAVAALGLDRAVAAERDDLASEPLNGEVTVPFHGSHQAGIDTDAQSNGTFIALDLRPATDRAALGRMMRVLTDDARRLAAGQPALADSEPELAVTPARLTVTFGFGPRFVEIAEGEKPSWLRPLPAFSIDQLDPAMTDGDLLIQVAADDAVTVSHAVRMLLKSARSFATLRWSQSGFRRAHGSEKSGTTMRNLLGQVDGTTNPVPGTTNFDRLVWVNDGSWLHGGTSVVIRRTRLLMDDWDRLGRDGRDQALGRFQSNGAPLTGTDEFDEPDFDATTALGFPVIPEFSHIARARPVHPDEQMFRRSYNYDDPPTGGSVSSSGLIFVAFQADVDRQFVPVQRRLAELDLLNQWTVPIGSAVFAIPPGCDRDGFIGETLLA